MLSIKTLKWLENQSVRLDRMCNSFQILQCFLLDSSFMMWGFSRWWQGKGRVCGQGEPQRPWRHPFSATPPPHPPPSSTPSDNPHPFSSPPPSLQQSHLPYPAVATSNPLSRNPFEDSPKKAPPVSTVDTRRNLFWHTVKALNHLIYSNIQMTLIPLAQMGMHVECRKVARWGFMFSLCP